MLPLRIGRKEARGRMIEIVDCVLQLLEDILMTLELARHIGERPDGHAGSSRLPLAERPHADAQPTPCLALVRADAHLLLAAAAFARRFQQAIDRFRHAGIADEYALDRPHVRRTRAPTKLTVGRIGINNSAVAHR